LYDLLFPTLLAVFCYAAAPAAGIVWTRIVWRRFRSRFFFLRGCPRLDYAAYRKNAGGVYQFQGVFDSFDGEENIFIKASGFSLNANILNADIYLLSADGAHEKLNPNKLPILTRNLQVFAGGELAESGGEWCFATTVKTRLLIIFFEGDSADPAELVCGCGRFSNYYWNPLSRYSYIAGTFTLVGYALQFLYRPAYQHVLICSLAYILLPFLSLLPPGLLLTMVSRRLFAESAHVRVHKDLSDYTEGRENAHRLSRKGNYLETVSWVFLLAGYAANIFFILLAAFVIF
jgi:hypothetical protein